MTTWDLAFQKLNKENHCELAIIVMNYMSYLDGNFIKKELFYNYYNKYEVDNSLELLAKLFFNNNKCRMALTRLQRWFFRQVRNCKKN